MSEDEYIMELINRGTTYLKNYPRGHPDSDRHVRFYSKHENPDYRLGMYIEPHCEEAQVHDYQEMYNLLEKLAIQYPGDVKLVSVGKTEGRYGPHNARHIWALHIFATEKSEKTAFFAAGHHAELSGPETVYSIAERLLKSYHDGNPNVKDFRKNTHLVFIPHVDSDLYSGIRPLRAMTVEEYFSYLSEGYSWLNQPVRSFEVNRYYYDGGEHHIDSRYMLKQTRAVRDFCDRVIVDYGKPHLAIDYHEGHGAFLAFESSPDWRDEIPLWILAAVFAEHMVPDERELEKIERSVTGDANREDLFRIMRTPYFTFSHHMASKGANSYTFEAPMDIAGWDLEERITMNLIATDRVFARYFLDIK